jgi:hypothetical protein
MKNESTFAACLLACLALTCGTSAQLRRTTQSADQNAAVKYLRADVALRQSYPLPPEAWTELEPALNRPLDAADERLIIAADEALTEFGHAAAVRKCEWEMSVEDGPLANTSHRGAIRELVAVSALRARMRLRDGRTNEAIQDLVAGYTAARHLSFDGSIASVLFGYKIERELSGVLEQSLSLLSPNNLDELEARLTKLPQSARMQAALESEKLDRNDLLEVVRGANTRDDVIDRLLAKAPILRGDRKAAEQIVDGCGGSVAGMTDCIQKQREFYDKSVSRFDLGPEQFQRQYEANFTEASIGNPVLAGFTPSLARLRWAEAYNDTRRVLLLAAIAVERGGEEGLARYPDPADDRAFDYSQSSDWGGFTLASQLRQDGKPISISIQRAKKNDLTVR